MTRSYRIPVNPPLEPGETGSAGQWWLADYTLCHSLGLDTNYQAQDAVTEHINTTTPPFTGPVTFDSERGCFFAYTDTEHDAHLLADTISDLVHTGPHPHAQPGPMQASPAYITLGPVHVPDNFQ